MTDLMEEAVARAICEAEPWLDDEGREDYWRRHRHNYVTMARAAIEAMQPAIERAFRAGIAYASNCKVTDIDEAWRTSRIRADMLGRGE